MCQKQILTHESKLIIIVSKTKVAREAYDNYIIEKCIAANCATGTNRNTGGRKKHDEAWMTSYRDFAVKYESGMTIMEIAAQGEISRRTAYRYKAYYDELQKNKGNMHE